LLPLVSETVTVTESVTVSVTVPVSVRATVPTALDVRLDNTWLSYSSGNLSTRYARSR
jgi:hypothetical protein